MMCLVRKILAVGLVLFSANILAQYAQARENDYPDSYKNIVAASKEEKGLVIYTNVGDSNWPPILEGFHKKYPWIKIQKSRHMPTGCFTQYYEDQKTYARTADLIVTAAPNGWHEFAQKGNLLEYRSAESDSLPKWSRPTVGLYTISTDPVVIVYSYKVFGKNGGPESLSDIQKLVHSSPEKFAGKLATYNASAHSFAYDIHWAAARNMGDRAWSFYDEVGKDSKLETGGSKLVKKVADGTYAASYFVSAASLFSSLRDDKIKRAIGWSFIKDGTPVFLRGMGITRGGSSPNSAKLMLDYILSHEGQVAVGQGGLTPYRQDVSDKEVPFLTYHEIEKAIGNENIVLIDDDPQSTGHKHEFLGRWLTAYGLED